MKKTNSKSKLEILAEEQERLISIAQLISFQTNSQKDISDLLVKGSKELTSELRLLSLVRAKIIMNKIRSADKIISSPTFQGLQFSKMEYFPPFIDPNLCNHYTYFCTFMRKNPEIFAKVLFEYCIKNPLKTTKIAYSVFLSLHQQGWCIEEDHMLFEVLTCMADLQFSVEEKAHQTHLVDLKPYPPRQLKYSLDTSDAAVAKYLPFITFSTSYLFNGASFAYLQTSLSPIILKLHSLSYLYDLRTTFETLENVQTVSLANFSYWKVILMYSKQVLQSLEQCLPLLPPSTFGLMAYLKSLNVDLFLVFFEAFINRALDSPAVLGLLSWHPSHNNWNPSKDIADIFRTKSLKSLPSKHLSCLERILSILPEYSEINIEEFLDLLILPSDSPVSYMISEAELLSTNPSFPKELLITLGDISLLHRASISFAEKNEALEKILQNMGDIPKKDENTNLHFRIVITRQANRNSFIELTSSRKPSFSLFRISSDPNINSLDNNNNKLSDPYAEFFCNTICLMPSPKQFGSKSMNQYFQQMSLVTSFFVPEKNIHQANCVLWYASTQLKNEDKLLKRINKVVNERDEQSMNCADRTSSLRTQKERIENYVYIVKSIRKNLQSHLNLELSECFAHDILCQQFIEAMHHSHTFITDLNEFHKVVTEVIQSAKRELSLRKIDETTSKQIYRILFFKMTEHVTFRRYMQSDAVVWKRSVIVSKILESKFDEIISAAKEDQPPSFDSNIHYLQRAADLLGHIRSNSGISVIVYYVIEAVELVQTLCKNCRELSFDGCLLWTIVTPKMKHIYLLSKFIQHFLLSGNFLDKFMSSDEISLLALLPSAVGYLVRLCGKYDKRVVNSWA